MGAESWCEGGLGLAVEDRDRQGDDSEELNNAEYDPGVKPCPVVADQARRGIPVLDADHDGGDGTEGNEVEAKEQRQDQQPPLKDVPSTAVTFEFAEVGSLGGRLDAFGAEMAVADVKIAEGTEEAPAIVAGQYGALIGVIKAGRLLAIGDGLGGGPGAWPATPAGQRDNSQRRVAGRTFAQGLKRHHLRGQLALAAVTAEALLS